MVAAVVFEENGFPVELYSTREIERAVAGGRLRTSTIVKTGFEQDVLRTSRADEVAFLRPLLGLGEPVGTPELGSPSPSLPPLRPAAPHASPPNFDLMPVQAVASSVIGESARPASPDTPGFWKPTSDGAAPAILDELPASPAAHVEPAGFMSRAFEPVRRYAVFDQRSSRAEFWSFQVVQLIGLVLLLGAGTAGWFTLAVVGLAIPNLAVAIRRLHDQDRSGWHLLWGVIPYVGWVVLPLLLLVEGTSGDNRFGRNPARR